MDTIKLLIMLYISNQGIIVHILYTLVLPYLLKSVFQMNISVNIIAIGSVYRKMTFSINNAVLFTFLFFSVIEKMTNNYLVCESACGWI